MASPAPPRSPVELRLPTRAASVSDARHRAAEFVRALGGRTEDIEIAVTEAVSNAVEHAYRGGAEGTISIRLETLVPDTVAITVSDDGAGIGPNLDREGLGLGLALIGRLATEFEIRPQRPHGTRLHMRFRLVPSTEEAPPRASGAS